MKRFRLSVLWHFSRPHTIIGTVLSVGALYAIAVSQFPVDDWSTSMLDLFLTLFAACSVNVFIVGINQIADVDIDRINKPFLPIASGELSLKAARIMVALSAGIALLIGATHDLAQLTAVLSGLAVGSAYSVPPLRFKRFPVLASLSIIFVRSVVVNLGVWLHFCYASGRQLAVHPAVWILIAVTIPFSLGIAILKDIPDSKGDRRYGIATFSIRFGARPILITALAALTIAELGMAIAGAVVLRDANRAVLITAEVAAVAVLWVAAAGVRLDNRTSVSTFYMRVWKLFFLQYAIMAAAYLLR